MDGTIAIRPSDRKVLLKIVKTAGTHEQRLRAHILLLLDDGCTWTTIADVLFTSSSTINRWRKRFFEGGIAAVVDAPGRRRDSCFAALWVTLVISWVTMRTPRDYGFYRSRWTCGTVATLLREDHGVRVSRETVRRGLRKHGLVYRRPRPVLGPKDPQRSLKLKRIRTLLRHLPADEMAVFQDEVDINTNPKIGSMWMRRGQQAEVVTPGNNVKRYLAGSLNWRTGELILTEGRRRNADLFLAHLDELRRRYRCFRVIHIICDNAAFHTPDRCRKVKEYMKRWGHRIQLHFLPTYAPDTNPIERVWWHLHEEITRNHRCQTMDELLELVMGWLQLAPNFEIEPSTYKTLHAA
jgi:putative transposase